MLIEAQRARDLKVAIFQAATVEDLEDDLQEWLDVGGEIVIVGIEFLSDGSTSFEAYVLYTE